jgi:uncharacterized protein
MLSLDSLRKLSHDPSNPLGTCVITDTRRLSRSTAARVCLIQQAQKAHTFLKAGVIKGLNIGYDTIQSRLQREC